MKTSIPNSGISQPEQFQKAIGEPAGFFRRKMASFITISILTLELLTFSPNALAQTINIDVKADTGGTAYIGNDGVLSGSGTYWNHSVNEWENMKDESGTSTSVDLLKLQGTGWSGSGTGTKIFAGWKILLYMSPIYDGPDLIYGIHELDPYKSYDVVLYYGLQTGAAKGWGKVSGEAPSSWKGCTNASNNTLPGTENTTYLRFSGVFPYEVSSNKYGIQINAEKNTTSTSDKMYLAGIQIKATGTRANIPPHFPTLVSPTNAATGIRLTPTLAASAFSDPDAGSTHANSQWQIALNSSFSSPILDTGTNVASTNFAITAGVLGNGTNYFWRVRYRDSAGNWSPYSTSSYFTTLPATYIITFDSQSGTTPIPATISVTNGMTYGTLATTTRNNYTFGGWWTGTNGTGTNVINTTTVNLSGPQTLYAKWTPNLISVTIQTSPAGRTFTVDGTNYTTAQVFNWIPGSLHTNTITSPQSGSTGTQYVFSSWSDGGAASHTVSPTTNTTYTASFTTQYYLTINASSGGTVSPASGWRNTGTTVTITASTNSGYVFNNWSGSGTGSHTGTNNPASITMNSAITETAYFILPPRMKNTISGTNMIISWPTNALGFSLRATNNVAGTAQWSVFTTNPPVVGTNYQVTISMTGKVSFFRLQK